MCSYEIENNCTLYICTDNYEIPSINEIQKKLESQNVEKKIEGMENLIFNIIQGEPYGNLLMCVIRFIVPHKDHRLKKMSHIFFEIVDKCNNDGSLKEEMILVCNALRNDIISPNEYVRGSTLRLLSKIKYLKILDPLIEAITKNLSHRHSYVRKNAISCIHTIIKEHGLDVIPNSVKEVEKMLFLENDISTKRSALSMLTDIDPLTTLKYILSLNDQLYDTADVILLEVIHLFKKLYIPHVFDDSYLLINDEDEENEEDREENGSEEEIYENENEEQEQEQDLAIKRKKELIDNERNINTSYKKKDIYNNNNNDNLNGKNCLLYELGEDIHQLKKKKVNENDYSQYKNNVIKILLNMLSKNVSNSVLYEGACCLLYMSNSALSIKTASECFIKLLINQHDNNIKLIVIDKLYYIMCKWKHILENYIMDLLRALSFPSRDIKIKILNLVLHVLTKRNVHLVLNVLKKELLKLNDQIVYAKNLTQKNMQTNTNHQLNSFKNINDIFQMNNMSTNYQEVNSYKKILIKSLQHICNMHSNECLNIVDLLLLYVNDDEKEINYEAAVCIRKLANNKIFQKNILQKIFDAIFDIKKPTILRIFFWILGQYMNDENMITDFMNKLYENLSSFLNSNIDLDIINKIQNEKFKKNKTMNFNLSNSNIQTKTVILEDGTYATEAFLKNYNLSSDDNKNNLHSFAYDLLCENDDLLLCVICVCLTKLYLKLLSKVNDSFEFLNISSNQSANSLSRNSSYNSKELNKTLQNGSVTEKISNSNSEFLIENINEFRNKSIYILASIIKYIGQKNAKCAISIYENDSNLIRINQCLKIFLKITNGKKIIDKQTQNLIRTFLNGDDYFQKFLEKEEEKYCCIYGSTYKNIKKKNRINKDIPTELIDISKLPNDEMPICEQDKANVDDDIYFRVLKEKKNILNMLDEESISTNENLEKLKLKYTLNNDILFEENEFKYPSFKHNYSSLFLAKLYNSQRLTGTDDDIFIEAFPIISNINLIIEFYVYNQSGVYLQNIYFNLSTHGNLKPIDKIPVFNLSPYEKRKFKISVKVHTTETGIIFGYIFYEKKNDSNKNYIVLNELNINMTDYINASFISSHLFRIMWSEFEWENKININTSIRDAFELLKLIIKNTNMTIVEKFMPLEYYELETKNRPEQANVNPIDIYISYISNLEDLKCLINNSAFFAINLFSRSIFGEDSLANLSIQKNSDGKLSGSIRVRSRTQGIALSLGDKITLVQTEINKEN
ncbi:coatamer beta subunit, putative [Plasmodium relictum]|uniref:Coatamer beta subunit, putative n=1 Tax=Plasmodium relictum TaxID=85471 RepID=A0A1J1HDJ6_PLARL|nr:coatamer beta subunit, putative [Plasmodium relictum]CRH03854.1 coatamer beta subunit, putative [Plasmodium relictum]